MISCDPLPTLRKPKLRHNLVAMEPSYPSTWAGLRYPWQRAELLSYLEELSAPHPQHRWAAERHQGKLSGIDEVVHFLFDDHDFNDADVGASLLDRTEVALVQSVKHELDQITQDLPQGGDDDYVAHSRWPAVTAAAVAAHSAISRR